MTTQSTRTLAALTCSLAALASQCARRSAPALESPQASPPAVPEPSHRVGAPTLPVAAAPPAAAPPAPVASGPRAEVTGEHHVLSAELTAPPRVPGATTLVVATHASGGYHMNAMYPISLELHPSNATAPERMRAAEASRRTEEVSEFRVPVSVLSGGATVTGTMRFAVCAADQCVLQSESFAVALP